VLGELSRVWTPVEKSTRLIGVQGSLLSNRFLWIGIALGVLTLTELIQVWHILIATALTSALFVLVTNYWWFLVLQPVLGVARNLGWLASQGYITSFASDDERPRLTGRFSFFGNIGQMAGPILVGGTASLVGFQYALLLPAAYAGRTGRGHFATP
jgi:hypothetical protein